ncbi:hypothetical protein V5O48_012763 [Marasmius crinis-equi]|uniref:Uncharacterized protein n=1 Tax=Marasmius crinis-equi TaxID=585013 RepID=A0ABR3F1X7_9AGAR
MPPQSTPPRWSFSRIVRRLFSWIMSANRNTDTDLSKSPYAVCQCLNLPHAQSLPSGMFENMVQEKDLECTIRAIALCKRTDGFQHETLVAIISLPGEPAYHALAFLERAGSWHDWSVEASMRNSGDSLPLADPGKPKVPHRKVMARDIITLLPSLYWRYHRSLQSLDPPFHELPQIIKKSTGSFPSSDTWAGDTGKQTELARVTQGEGMAKGPQAGPLFEPGRQQRDHELTEDQPPAAEGEQRQTPPPAAANSEVDHVFIYAIMFPEEAHNPPTVLDLAIAFKVVSEHRPDYTLVQSNCYFLAAAICKLMAKKFGGRKVQNKELDVLQSPPSSSATESGTYELQWLRKAGLKPRQILREDSPRLTRMVEELVAKFDVERQAHPVMKNRQTEARLTESEAKLTESEAKLAESNKRVRELELRLQQLSQRTSPPANASSC